MEFETPKSVKKEPGSLPGEKKPEEAREEGVVYVMPEKFRKQKSKAGGKSKGPPMFVTILILAGIVLVGGGIGFYYWAQKYYQPAAPPVAEPTQPEVPIEAPTTTPARITPSPEETLKAEVKDEQGLVSYAEFYLPEGALTYGTRLKLTAQEAPEETTYKDYKVIGALYKITPHEVTLYKECNLNIYYEEKLIQPRWEKDLVLAYFKDELWTELDSEVNLETNIMKISFKKLIPAETIALVINKKKMVPAEGFVIAPHIPMSQDSDNDGLTDVEEVIYLTSPQNPDSDVGGGTDGEEIIKLMDPNKPGEQRLATSGLIRVYTNPTFYYSIFYPTSWLVRAIPETGNKEVLIITSTGEFFSITIEDNLEELSVLEWYLRQAPGVDEQTLTKTKVAGHDALWSPDHLTIYIAREDKVYILSYNTGTEEKANFKTTFEMIIASFQFVEKPKAHPERTLVQYPDSSTVYLIEDGKKRAFKSGEAFEALGYKWTDIVKISLDETYPDGEPLE